MGPAVTGDMVADTEAVAADAGEFFSVKLGGYILQVGRKRG
jgi:hypothetical protein